MDFKDYYKIIGIKKEATQAEIKRAYKKLARRYHPDVSKEKDAEERFKELGEAYEVLKDPEKRAAYDRLGANWKAGQDFNPPPDWDAGFEFNGGGFTGGNAEDYSDFFESLFGQNFRQNQTHSQHHGFQFKGQDHHAKVFIDLEDAYQGTTRSIVLQSPTVDDHGQVNTQQRTLNVKIPKGVKQGQRIRLSGQGAPGMGDAPNGDLYLEIEFNPHSLYQVQGHDVYLNLPITPWEAALGTTVKVPTPSGTVDVKISADTPNGRKMRLKSRGIPSKNPGDLYIVIQLTIPKADTEKAKTFYREMEKTLPYNPRRHMGV